MSLPSKTEENGNTQMVLWSSGFSGLKSSLYDNKDFLSIVLFLSI